MTAVVAHQHPAMWQRRQDHSMPMPGMSMPGMVPAFEASTRSAAVQSPSRAFQPPQVDMAMPVFPNSGIPNSMPYHAGGFAYDPSQHFGLHQPYSMPQPVTLAPAVTYAGPPSIQSSVPQIRDVRSIISPVNRSPPLKAEAPSPVPPSHIFPDSGYIDNFKRTSPAESETGVNFSTDVDTLMKAIQSKADNTQQEPSQVLPQPGCQDIVVKSNAHINGQKRTEEVQDAARGSQKPRKRYQCSIPNCNKSFYQKTHLEIHTRAHTGVKPFLCKEPSCGQRFSQLGNLKTHERRHTGERPYKCDICGKTFAQRGNVRAHKIVHQQIKPFTCRLDDCGKQFTQLGNLKSHQNKFHAPALRFLTQKFASIREGDPVSAQDKELWEYFASLYKNSNKGIKGRGKDRRISTATSSASSASSTSAASASMYQTGDAASHEGARSSRSSSYASSPELYHRKPEDGFEFGHGVGVHVESEYHQPTHHAYGNLVFPERKIF